MSKNLKNWFSRPKYLLLTTFSVATVFHAYLLGSGMWRRSYDAYTHIFFAQFYRDHWFGSWNPKWFSGFSTYLYPPLVHQLLALASKPMGFIHAYSILQFIIFIGLIGGIYLYSRIWISAPAAAIAAGLGAALTSVIQGAYQYGQLPTLFALTLTLYMTYFFEKCLRHPTLLNFVVFSSAAIATATSHHITLFLGTIFFVSPVALAHLKQNRWEIPTFLKILGIVALAYFLAFCTLLPFIHTVLTSDLHQKIIPHASRNNFLHDLPALKGFFLVPNSWILLFLPFALRSMIRDRYLLILGVFWFAAMVLGLGDTTFVAKFVLRSMFDVLTLDRFTLWSTVLILPLIAFEVNLLRSNLLKLFILIFPWTVAGFLVFTLKTIKFQPEPINIEPIVQLLQRETKLYRYVTLGFGAQMAWLNTVADAPTVDGLYFTARTDPVLKASGIEAIDSSKYFGSSGEVVARNFLQNPRKYSLHYAFVNDLWYKTMLLQYGWHLTRTFPDGVGAWMAPQVESVPAVSLDVKQNFHSWKTILWGTYPVWFFVFIFLCCMRLKRNGYED